MLKVLVVGQTPPPLHGQAIMIQQLLQTKLPKVKIFYMPMHFSREMGQVGKFSVSKILELFKVIVGILSYRIMYNVRILYYPPAGPNMLPMIRDLVILGTTRWLFSKTIFHFHAGGISEVYPTLSFPLRALFRKAYFYPDIAIRTSSLAPSDGTNLRAIHDLIIPNGIEDIAQGFLTAIRRKDSQPVKLLYVGALCESKGLQVLLSACQILTSKGVAFHLDCLGVFRSASFREQIMRFITHHGLQTSVTFHGEVAGPTKWDMFSQADIFCFPSHFESETFGLAILEAMSFRLPIVATRWRGLPILVQDGISGFLVPVKDAELLADRIEQLIDDPTLRSEMGMKGREIFLKHYSLQRHQDDLEKMFALVGGGYARG